MRRWQSEDNMSDAKSKRTMRESVQREPAPPPLPPPAKVETAPAPQPAVDPVTAAVATLPAASANAAHPASSAMPDDLFAYSRQALAAITEAQTAAARGAEAMLGEMTTFVRSELAAATEGATALLGAKTFSEAFEVNLGYARRSFDALVGSSAKLSEIGAKTASDASRPILSRIGESWKALNIG
jgi:hypothetical protein